MKTRLKKQIVEEVLNRPTEYILLVAVILTICFKYYPFMKHKYEERQTKENFYYQYYDYVKGP